MAPLQHAHTWLEVVAHADGELDAMAGGDALIAFGEIIAEIFTGGESRPQSVDELAKAIAARDFVPNLAPQALAGLERQKKFLRDFGYIKNDFAISDWVDSSFLERALASFD
jgi:hypothetical protein